MKVINKILALIFLIFSNYINLYSQTKFENGYIVDINKDTIKGSIDNRNWDKSPRAVSFKNNSDSEEIIFTPDKIQGFGVAGEKYISAVVTIDESVFRENELLEYERPLYKTDTVFIQVLVEGRKSLYYLKDKNLKEHFFIFQNGVYETLAIIRFIKRIGDGRYVQVKELFKGQLNNYLQDCPLIQYKINTTGYTRNDLIRLFNEYYKCTQQDISYGQKLEKLKSEFGILGGLSQTKLRCGGNSDDFIALMNTDFSGSKNFTFGGFYNIILPRKNGRWSIRNELMFTAYKVSGTYRDSYNVDIYTDYFTSVGFSYIKLNNMLKLRYPVKNMFFFVSGGISNGVAISETNNSRAESHVYSVNYSKETPAFVNPHKWERGILLGLGSNIKNFSFEFRLEKSDGMSTYVGLSSQVIRYFYILGYKF